jgi:hypothetical protein
MPRSSFVSVLAALALAGCGNDLAADAAATPASSGLPCDVQAVLADHCEACHGTSLAGGAPIHLATYADLTAKNAAGVTVAQRCLDRMKSTSAQMPPPPAASATSPEIASFEAWVTQGMPGGDCAGGGGPFDGPSVCTSGTHWTGGNRESPQMHPGAACISCHTSSGEAPRFNIAGTVYPTGHEPTDCNGATAGAVEVTDARGTVTVLTVNAAGNFFSTAAFVSPIHVAVVKNGVRRAMSGSPPSGDCNSCHTETGASMAPGRITLP